MTTLTLSPAAQVRDPLSPPSALSLTNDLFRRPAGAPSAAERPGLARHFLLALLRSLTTPAA
jgi:hypothetical protein